jgi:hypothetical protein
MATTKFPILRVWGDDGCRHYFKEGDGSDPSFSMRVSHEWAESQVGLGRARYIDSVQDA